MLIYPTKMWWDENLSLVEKEEISATNKIKVKKKKKKKKIEVGTIEYQFSWLKELKKCLNLKFHEKLEISNLWKFFMKLIRVCWSLYFEQSLVCFTSSMPRVYLMLFYFLLKLLLISLFIYLISISWNR